MVHSPALMCWQIDRDAIQLGVFIYNVAAPSRSYWKAIISERLSVGACGFMGVFVRLELPWFSI